MKRKLRRPAALALSFLGLAATVAGPRAKGVLSPHQLIPAKTGMPVLAAGGVPRYVFSLAGNFPGALCTYSLAINSTHIVGYYINGSDTAQPSYIQTGKSFLEVQPPGSANGSSYLSGINSQGVAVGGFCTTKGGCVPEHAEHGYAYDHGTFSTIDYPLSGASTAAYGINDAGEIVGGYCPQNVSCPAGLLNPTTDGFLYSQGVFTTMDFPGANATSPFAINNAGSIVGFYETSGLHSFLYQNGVYTNIDFPGSAYSVVTAINNFGVVAGLFEDQSARLHGYLYQNGKFTQIDVPQGIHGTSLTGINDRGDIVGILYPAANTENFKGIPIPANPR